MPRDGSGVYSLPAGNPVVTNTIISSTWANGTLSDIAAQLNNVLTRDGLLGPTGPFKLQDGTVNAPGLAWASEPGLGWYRPGASQIGMSAGGAPAAFFDWSVAGATQLTLLPRSANGQSTFAILNNNDGGSVVSGIFRIDSTAQYIDQFKTGPAVSLPLRINNPVSTTFNAPFVSLSPVAGTPTLRLTKASAASGNDIYGYLTTTPRWVLRLGQGDAGDDFAIGRYNDAGALVGMNLTLSRSTGLATFSNSLTTLGATYVQAGKDKGPTMFWDGGVGCILNMNGTVNGNWAWRFDNSTGAIQWQDFAGISNINIDGGGTIRVRNQGYKPGGGAWLDSSDARLKENVEDYTTGLEAVLGLRPVTYNFIAETERDTSVLYTGLIAQEAEVFMPEMVTVKEGVVGRAAYADMRTLDTTSLPYALINAIKTLNDRLMALETA